LGHLMESSNSARLPDTVDALVRILVSTRLRARKRVALLLILEGVGYRRAAHAVGLRDHMALHRAAGRMGLRRLHNERARYLASMHKLDIASSLLFRMSAGKGGLRDSVRAFSLATDALIAVRTGARY
jgi:hypothetical protein